MSDFGEIEYIALRTIWPYEALNFTPWLQENIQKLGEVLGMDLEIVACEASVGNFSLDLLARDVGSAVPSLSRISSEPPITITSESY